MDRDRQNSIQSFAFVLSVCVAVSFCCGFVSVPLAGESTSSQHKIETEGRINPNYAPIESLVRLPGLGISRAGAIVAYRESFGQADGISTAFERADDLQKIKGIGPKTVQGMSEWVKFE
jgi:competence protein ComEA